MQCHLTLNIYGVAPLTLWLPVLSNHYAAFLSHINQNISGLCCIRARVLLATVFCLWATCIRYLYERF